MSSPSLLASSPSKTLAQTLGTTTPVSTLLRKARRFGIKNLEQIVQLAVQRGCKHYAASVFPDGQPKNIADPGTKQLPNDELTILLLIGEHPYQPQAIRCAGQLARSFDVIPRRLALLALKEKCERTLFHIAKAGSEHDPEGACFWAEVLSNLPYTTVRLEPNLPHWTRFVSMPGRQRHGRVPARWLIPH